MNYEKLGLVYKASEHKSTWARHSALTPTPFFHPNGFIRVFCGFRDDVGTSRIGYVDVTCDDPRVIIGVSKEPALDIGRSGCFDDAGVILGDVVEVDQKLYMAYVGFQKVEGAKFLAFTGIAVSVDYGEQFFRVSEAPILGRALGQTTIAAIHSLLLVDGVWRIYYASGDGWEIIDSIPYPRYEICYLEGSDLLDLPRRGSVVLPVLADEYRIGRPRVFSADGSYWMYYTSGNRRGDYLPGIAASSDGVSWQRSERPFPLKLSASGWDSRHLCYPCPLVWNGKTFIFYNGNNMGRDGFGVAVSL